MKINTISLWTIRRHYHPRVSATIRHPNQELLVWKLGVQVFHYLFGHQVFVLHHHCQGTHF